MEHTFSITPVKLKTWSYYIQKFPSTMYKYKISLDLLILAIARLNLSSVNVVNIVFFYCTLVF